MAGYVRKVYRLTKPGIVYGNTFALLSGYLFFALNTDGFLWLPLIGAVIGTAAIMASACVINNVLDRDIDSKMARTRQRASVTGEVSVGAATMLAIGLFVLGVLVLFSLTSIKALCFAVLGWILYAFVYTYVKRLTYHGTLVGAIPGALPPVIGFYAVDNNRYPEAIMLFVILVAWQMIHFYAIAIFRCHDYEAAGIPVISIVKGLRRTLFDMRLWLIVLLIWLGLSSIAAGWQYSLLMLPLGLWMLSRVYRPLNQTTVETWSRQVFGSSLVFLAYWLAILAVLVIATKLYP